MINTHRCHHLIPTVHRERYLDTIAREHAHSMASEQTLFQISTPYEIHHKLQVLQEHEETNTYENSNTTFTRIGVNIGKLWELIGLSYTGASQSMYERGES